MTDRQRHEWIEQYLLGELSEAESAVFEERMEKDPAFAREVAFQRTLHESVTDEEGLSFRAKLDQIKKKLDREGNSGTVRVFPWRALLAVAASLAILVLAAHFLLRDTTPDEPAEIFAFAEQEGWPVYPNSLFPGVLRGGEERGPGADSSANVISTVKSAYLAGDYQQALRVLEQLPADSIGSDRFFFYRGLLQMRSDQPEAAIASFDQVGPGTFYDAARWNRALSLIAAGRPDQAVPILEAMREEGFKAEEAQRLLEMLGAESGR